MKAPLATIIVVTIAAVGLASYFYLGGTVTVPGTQTDVTPQNAGQHATLSGAEVANQILDFVNTLRTGDGFYSYSSNCPDANCPFYNAVYKNANTWPVYGKIGMYRATGDKKYLDSAKVDADAMLAWCSLDPRQCVRVGYQIYGLSKDTGDAKYSDFVKNEVGVLLQNEGGFADTNMSMLLGTDSIILADDYILTKDPKVLQSAVDKMNQADAVLAGEATDFTVNGKDFKAFGCWPQLAKLSIYDATGDKGRLNDVAAFANSMNISSNVADIGFMTDVQPCIDVYEQLAADTGDASYKTSAEKMAQYLISNFWDSQYRPIPTGQGGMRLARENNYETVTDASYMVYLLSKLKDSKFEVN